MEPFVCRIYIVYHFQLDYASYAPNYYLLNLESTADATSFSSSRSIIMTRVKSSKGPCKVHSFSKQHPDRARRKTHAQGKGKGHAIDDVYEYAPSKVRRAKVALSLDRHEIEGRRYGSGDEDIDSEDAFEESDRDELAGSGLVCNLPLSSTSYLQEATSNIWISTCSRLVIAMPKVPTQWNRISTDVITHADPPGTILKRASTRPLWGTH